MRALVLAAEACGLAHVSDLNGAEQHSVSAYERRGNAIEPRGHSLPKRCNYFRTAGVEDRDHATLRSAPAAIRKIQRNQITGKR
jgi:hypothetical protein